MQKAKCPFCGSDVEVGAQPKMGQRVYCHDCDSELEVVWMDPLELDWPLEEYEIDFDDYENYEEFEEYDEDQ